MKTYIETDGSASEKFAESCLKKFFARQRLVLHFYHARKNRKIISGLKKSPKVNVADGATARITDDFNDYFGMSISNREGGENFVQLSTPALNRATD